MSLIRSIKQLLAISVASVALVGTGFAEPAQPQSGPQSLEKGFQDPPASARPRVWWHWMNGNVTLDGIEKDIDWLSRIGIGGLQNFDANLETPQIVSKRLIYMQPDWKDAFRRAVRLADQKGLEFAIAASPGWSETGGPWVPPQDGIKKLVWGETVLAGGKRFSGKLPALPGVTGPFQTIKFAELFVDPKAPAPKIPEAGGEIAVLAYPIAEGSIAPIEVTTANGGPKSPTALSDDDLETSVDIALPQPSEASHIGLRFAKPVTVKSARLFIKNARAPFGPPRFKATLQAQQGGNWISVGEFPLTDVPTTISFAEVTAARFRLAIAPSETAISAGGLGSVPGAVIYDLFPQSNPSTLAVGDFQLFPETRVGQAEVKAGFATVPNYHDIASTSDVPAPGPDTVIDLTNRVDANGNLHWAPPKGRNWRVIRFGWSLTGKTNHPATPEATGLEVDKYDPAAVRRYLETYLGMYRETVGPELFGSHGIRALLTDSIEVGAANWTPRLLDEFKARRGYDAGPWLPVLAGAVLGSPRRSDAFLYDYRRTLGELMAEAHYATVAQVAHENGLKVYGEALEDGRPVLGDDLAMRSKADVPMAALWTFNRGEQPRTGLLGDMKGAASVAHYYGQNLVAAESMTSAFSPWAFAPSDLKRIIDLEFAMGVNRPVIHTSVHQPEDQKLPGLSLAVFGQYFTRHETWAEMAKPWVDYISRTSFMLQQGKNRADVAIFYGEDTPVATLFSQGVPSGLPKGYAYDFINNDMLAGLKVTDAGELEAPGGVRYKAIALAGTSQHMTLGTLRRLKILADAKVRIIGPRPTGSPGLADDQAEFEALAKDVWSHPNVRPSTDIEGELARLGILPDFVPAGGDPDADVLFVHRELPEGDAYFLTNRQNRNVKLDARFRVTGKAAEFWDAITGRTEDASYRIEGEQTVVPIELAPEGSIFVLFRKAAPSSARDVKRAALRDAGAVTAPWQVSFQSGRGAPPKAIFPALAPLETNTDPGIRYFSGVATYKTEIRLPASIKPSSRLWLDLGKVGDVAEVLINGRPVGTVWFSPNRLNVGSYLKPGKNQIEIRVANLWVNRLIGDQQPGAAKVTWTAVPTYKADAPLRPSGLIGPVRLLEETPH